MQSLSLSSPPLSLLSPDLKPTISLPEFMESAQALPSPSNDGDSVNGASAVLQRNKKVGGLRNREELEREVSSLCDLLSREEKVREILEHVHARSNGSSISIPKLVPPKSMTQVKELLAELAMVEDEIARLEGQISQLQSTLKLEQEESKSRLSESNQGLGRVTPSMHFISKAIIGDYNAKDYASAAEKSRNPSGSRVPKENEECKFQEKVGRSGGSMKPSSPLRDSRHPTHKDRRHHEAAQRRSPLVIPLPLTIKEDDESKWEPNKLSEGIMKCLNLIYVRLLRTWRAMEMEKPCQISRSIKSLSSSPGSRSLRVDSVGGMEPRQQDPYGVFIIEGSIPRDIGPYKNLVRFTSASLNPKCISSSSSIPLLKTLRELMSLLQTVDLRLLNDQQKLAFWINMYNACLMHGFLQYGVPSTPEKLHAITNKASLNIGGNVLYPQAIEHYILRRPSSSAMSKEPNEAFIRGLYGLNSVDPNVTFALCRGTHSSPAVRIYTAEGVTAELERSKVEYLQASMVVTTKRKIGIPEPVVGKMVDFAGDMESLAEWVCQQLPNSGTLRKSMVDCLREHNYNNNNNIIRISSTTPCQVPVSVEKIPSEPEFRYLLAM